MKDGVGVGDRASSVRNTTANKTQSLLWRIPTSSQDRQKMNEYYASLSD